jgi:hypothetical protein
VIDEDRKIGPIEDIFRTTLAVVLALLLLALIVSLTGCKTMPVDPNLTTLTQSIERQQERNHVQQRELEAQHALNDQKTLDKCAAPTNDADRAVCFLGAVALKLAGNATSNSNGAAQAPVMPAYQRPPTPVEQFATGVGAVSGLVNPAIGAFASYKMRKSDNATTVAVAGISANRETATVQALSNAITMPPPPQAAPIPTYNIGGDYIGGNFTTTDTETTTTTTTTTEIDVSIANSQIGTGNRMSSPNDSYNDNSTDTDNSVTNPPQPDAPVEVTPFVPAYLMGRRK